MNDKKTYGFTTTILHSDRQKGIEHGSLHKPIHTSVTFGYEDARQLAEVFQGKQPGYRYGRQGNPTVSALEGSSSGGTPIDGPGGSNDGVPSSGTWNDTVAV